MFYIPIILLIIIWKYSNNIKEIWLKILFPNKELKTNYPNNIYIKISSDNYYSHTYSRLKLIIPPKTKSMEFLDELINNRTINILNCCNPYCKKNLTNEYYCSFDGYYCGVNCQQMASKYISHYWEQL